MMRYVTDALTTPSHYRRFESEMLDTTTSLFDLTYEQVTTELLHKRHKRSAFSRWLTLRSMPKRYRDTATSGPRRAPQDPIRISGPSGLL
jgi:hypothetical protein